MLQLGLDRLHPIYFPFPSSSNYGLMHPTCTTVGTFSDIHRETEVAAASESACYPIHDALSESTTRAHRRVRCRRVRGNLSSYSDLWTLVQAAGRQRATFRIEGTPRAAMFHIVGVAVITDDGK